MSTPQIIYSLSCKHAAPGPATLVNGTLWCAWCDERNAITGVIIYEWKAYCRDCKFARWAGLSKHNAGIFATGHVRRNPGHTAGVEYTQNPEAVKTAGKIEAWQVGTIRAK
jgi:hypothetical protein